EVLCWTVLQPSPDRGLPQRQSAADAGVIAESGRNEIEVEPVVEPRRRDVAVEAGTNVVSNPSKELLLAQLPALRDAATEDHPVRRENTGDVGNRLCDVSRFELQAGWSAGMSSARNPVRAWRAGPEQRPSQHAP